MNIKELIQESYQIAKDHGWHDTERDFGGLLALIHSEVSETLEEYRKGCDIDEVYFSGEKVRACPQCMPGICEKPEGIPVELADVCIRIFDLCGHYGIDLERAIELKMNYNKTRSFRHGGKRV